MARRRSEPTPQKPPGTITVHQVVAYNFRRAREMRGWTQAQTSDELEPLLGYKLRQAGVSAIEKTYDGDRPRNLDVGELAAFARAFNVPIVWFFVPPPDLLDKPVETLDAPDYRWTLGIDLVVLLLGGEAQWLGFVERIRELLDIEDPEIRHLAERMIGDMLSGGVDLEVEMRMEKRRQAVRELRIAEILDSRDEFVQQMAGAFLQLVEVTKPEIRKTLLRDPAEALRILNEAPESVDREPLTIADVTGSKEE